jgi:RNAse (barnase) inhibitor barstar
MDEKPTFRIDGAAFSDLEGFYDEIESEMTAGRPWGRNLAALDELLRGEGDPLPREFRLIWEHADLSRRRLGAEGEGSFIELVELIARHPNVELVLS